MVKYISQQTKNIIDEQSVHLKENEKKRDIINNKIE